MNSIPRSRKDVGYCGKVEVISYFHYEVITEILGVCYCSMSLCARFAYKAIPLINNCPSHTSSVHTQISTRGSSLPIICRQVFWK